MILIITGSRSVYNLPLLVKSIKELQEENPRDQIGTIYVGDAKDGVDKLVADWHAKSGRHKDLLRTFNANWGMYPQAAGSIRNQAMIDAARGYSVQVLAIWDGQSTGTADCMRRAKKAGYPVKFVDASEFADMAMVARQKAKRDEKSEKKSKAGTGQATLFGVSAEPEQRKSSTYDE